jgi:hypothetical protein
MLIAPLAPPKQVTGVIVDEMPSVEDDSTVTTFCSWHPCASVMVTLYVLGSKPVMVEVVWPLLHK